MATAIQMGNNNQPMTRKRARLIFDAMVAHLEEKIPGFEIRYKNESWSQKLIAVLIYVFNRKYMSRYVTTIYPRVYFPSREFVEKNPWTAAKILAHEYVHLFDAKGVSMYWKACYLSPQLLLLALAGIASVVLGTMHAPWWSHAIGTVAALLPWPSPWRRDAELRGYAMNMLVNVWRHGTIRRSTIEWIVDKFTGAAYYFMWPFRKGMNERVLAVEGDITFGRIWKGHENKPYQEVIAILEASKA
jgi:hypothetical protein